MLANRVMMGSWRKAEDAGLPVTDGLLGWWKFDDGAGQVLTDYSGNGNHGTIMGTGATWTSKGLQTTINSWVETTNLFDFYTNQKLTWILAYKHGTPVNSFPTIMGASSQGIIYAFNYPSWHHRTFWFYSKKGYTDEMICSDNSLEFDTPMVLAVTYDDPNIATYLDGETIFSETLPGLLYPEDGEFHFSDTDPGFSNDYEFYYALVYDRALTVQEISDVYAYIQAELAKRGVTI